MKTLKKLSIVNKTVGFLQDKITSGQWKSGMRLPGYSHLAQQAGVSYVTIQKAVTVLKNKNVLCGKKKVGTYVGTNLPPVKQLSVSTTGQVDTIHVVAEQIKQNILNGTYRTQEFFPSFKELKNTYKAGFRVLKQALDVLVEEEILVAHARKYSVKQLHSSPSYNTIYLLIKSDLLFQKVIGFEAEWISSFTLTLEKECTLRNINLVKIPLEDSHALTSAKTRTAMGFFIWYGGWVDDVIISEALRRIISYKKPLAICNMMGYPDPFLLDTILKSTIDPVTLKHRNIFVYSNFKQEQRSGFLVGRYLYGKGHRKVCYFARKEDRAWAGERLVGLQKAFASMGIHDAVVPLFAPLTPEEPGLEQASPVTSIKEMQSIESEEQFLSDIDGIATKNQDKYDLYTFVKSNISEYQYRLELQRLFVPTFTHALQHIPASAWVCSNDYLANFVALNFLNKIKPGTVKKPGLISCDDLTASLFNNLSAYNFNLSGVARTMLNAVLYPDLVKRKKSNELWYTISMDGMVIDRGSV